MEEKQRKRYSEGSSNQREKLTMSLTSRIAAIVNDPLFRLKATGQALLNQNDGYHILMAIHEHGEQAVQIEMAKQIAEKEGISFTEAARKASFYIEYSVMTSNGDGYGKSTRNGLNNK
ncbi:hypothetical protein [Photobacterium leiognathi]|uniref:hypothetical protein n=1 Tax=Photobacterium leiognathi TaxID=553611 RepID=UPI00298227B8|nr:hypothetical protein [Photobacterium leiognathi]